MNMVILILIIYILSLHMYEDNSNIYGNPAVNDAFDYRFPSISFNDQILILIRPIDRSN